jgi:hypothetical protein
VLGSAVVDDPIRVDGRDRLEFAGLLTTASSVGAVYPRAFSRINQIRAVTDRTYR